MKLVYVFDAYCGWSFGFAPTLAELVQRHPDLEVEVLSGGLFTGTRRVPVREFGYVQGANAKITELTGATFGPGYARLIEDGSFVMDSVDAARGVIALRDAAPDRIVELVTAMQQAFYEDGLSLSDPGTYRSIAAANGLNGDRLIDTFVSPSSILAANAEFSRAADLGVRSFPTLLAIDDDHRQTGLAVGHATVDQIERHLTALTDAS